MHIQSVSNQYSMPSTSSSVGGIVPDQVSSCAGTLDLAFPLTTAEIPNPGPGDVVLARVEEVNPAYPAMELPDGTDIILEPGMTIVGALGTRKALHGFSGRIPHPLFIGQHVQLLNKGGVIGECTAFHRNLEWPTLLTYLGTVVEGDRPVNLRDSALPFVNQELPKVPLVFVLGTCMNSGKTTVCKTIIDGFSKRGYQINSGKVAGVACRRDLNVMKQSGSERVLSFHDFGLPSSADVPSLVPVARSIVHHLADPEPDFIVLEMGDGILGGYNVSSLFEDKELLSRRAATVICANDLMGTWGALEWLRQHDVDTAHDPILVSGPVTDSCEGVKYIEDNWGVQAANPFDSSGKLCSFVLKSLRPC